MTYNMRTPTTANLEMRGVRRWRGMTRMGSILNNVDNNPVVDGIRDPGNSREFKKDDRLHTRKWICTNPNPALQLNIWDQLQPNASPDPIPRARPDPL